MCLVDLTFVVDGARVADASVETGESGRLAKASIDASLLRGVVTEHGRNTASKAAKGRKTVQASTIVASVISDFLVGEARTARNVDARSWVVAALARSLIPFRHVDEEIVVLE